MDTTELLRRAWEAVEKSGVPESLHEAAFREAVEDLRATAGSNSPQGGGGASKSGKPSKGKASSRAAKSTETSETASVNEHDFFANLAQESGVPEGDLHDVLSLSGGAVHVTQPSRKLGSSRADQAKTVIALVAGARAFGLDERPVDATAVRKELERKGCYDQNNFATAHLGPLRGFNAGANRTQIVTTSHWDKEFSAAVDRVLERDTDAS